MLKKITKAVFPVAGLGTRFFPATKSCPKEMLPVVDKPLIQYAVEEAIAAGATELIFISSRTKKAIQEHFNDCPELEGKLEQASKSRLLNTVKRILPSGICCKFIEQEETLGLGHAVSLAKQAVGENPFMVLLADDLIFAPEVPCLTKMVELSLLNRSSVLAVETVPKTQVSLYGVIDPEKTSGLVTEVKGIVEKPAIADAPSNLSVVGRYVLQPEIFDILDQTVPGYAGEIQLTDAIAVLLKKQRVQGYQFEGVRYDCGNKLGYLTANVEFALRDKSLAEEFQKYLIERVSTLTR